MPDNLPLRDIHLPDSVSWWPPAIGWWLVLVLSLLLIGVLIYSVRQFMKPRLKKRAKAAIDAVISDYRVHGDALQFLQALSIILRRVGISYLDRNEVSGIHGVAWYHRLNQLTDKPLSDDSIDLLSEAPYRSVLDGKTDQVTGLIEQLQGWVSGLPKYPVKQSEGRHV